MCHPVSTSYLAKKYWGMYLFQGIVRFRDRGNQYQYLSESGSFVEVHFYRDSLLVDFLAALYAHTEGMESRDFSKSKLVSR